MLGRTLVSLVALAAVVWWATRQDAPRLPSGAGPLALVALALVLYATVTVVRAERWLSILRRTGVHFRRRTVYGVTTIGYMGNNLLPARAGEALRVVLLSRRSSVGKRDVIGTIIAERLLDALVLGLALVAVAYPLLRGAEFPVEQPFALIGGGIVALALLAVLALWLVRPGRVALVIDYLRPIAAAPRALLSRHGLALVALTLSFWALQLALYYAAARAVGFHASVPEVFYLLVLTNLAGALPAAPGQLGTFDAALLFGAEALQVSGSVAVGYLLLLRLVLFLPVTIVGAVVLVVGFGGWPSNQRAMVKTESELSIKSIASRSR